MSDDWENTYLGGTNAALGGAMQDRDGDGFSNLHEYIAGTNPTNAASLLKFMQVSPGAASNFVLDWASVAGKVYSVEWIGNMLDSAVADGREQYCGHPAAERSHGRRDRRQLRLLPRGRAALTGGARALHGGTCQAIEALAEVFDVALPGHDPFSFGSPREVAFRAQRGHATRTLVLHQAQRIAPQAVAVPTGGHRGSSCLKQGCV
jgi:hypothetical protein